MGHAVDATQADTGRRRSVLLVAPRYPWPARRGDQKRVLQYLDALCPTCEVTLLAPSPPDSTVDSTRTEASKSNSAPEILPENCRLVSYRRPGWFEVTLSLTRALLRGTPFQAALFCSTDLRRRVFELAPQHDRVVLLLSRLEPIAEGLDHPHCIVDLVDSLALNAERRAAFDRRWRRPFWRAEAWRLLAAERRLLQNAAAGIVVAERDRRFLSDRLGLSAPASWHVLPLGLSAPRPVSKAERASFDLVLTGNLGYFPTDDGIHWFLDRVWPRLRAQRGIRLLLAGSRPSRRLRSRLRSGPSQGIEMVIDPPDLGAEIRRGRVALAPLRAGSGQPIKILEAWAEGVPVVATTWAAAGTSGAVGEDLLVADTADEWVETILRLLEDPERRQLVAASAEGRLASDYAPSPLAEALLVVVREAGSLERRAASR